MDLISTFWWMTFLVGLAMVTKGLYIFMHAVYVHFGGFQDHQKRLRSYGNWAVVTGVSRGIGNVFAEEFAKLGINLILVGRKPLDNIIAFSDHLKATYLIDCEVICFDFNRKDLQQLQPLKECIYKKDVGIFLNAAGVMYDIPKEFNQVSQEDIDKIITVNCLNATMLVQTVSQRMIERKTGLLVLMSSISHAVATPYLSVYAASKAYISSFCNCLQVEMEDHGVFCQSLEPSYVATDMTAYNKYINTRSFFIADANDYVQSAIKSLGLTHQTTGYFSHNLTLWSPFLLPTKLVELCAKKWIRYTMSKH